MTQNERVLSYLKKNESATGLELLRHTGCICYTKTISDLRRELPSEGYTIVSEFVDVKTKYNGISRVKLYTLTKIKSKSKAKKKNK